MSDPILGPPYGAAMGCDHPIVSTPPKESPLMTKLESLLGCATLLGCLAAALYTGEARAADLPMTEAADPAPSGCDFWVPTVYGTLSCAGVQYGGGSTQGPSTAPNYTAPPAPPSPPPTPPSDPCGPKGEGGDKHGHGEGRGHGHHGKGSPS